MRLYTALREKLTKGVIIKKPKSIIVKYVRKTKDGQHQAQSIGFAYTPGLSLDDNVEIAVDFVRTIHDVVCVGSVVLKY